MGEHSTNTKPGEPPKAKGRLKRVSLEEVSQWPPDSIAEFRLIPKGEEIPEDQLEQVPMLEQIPEYRSLSHQEKLGILRRLSKIEAQYRWPERPQKLREELEKIAAELRRTTAATSVLNDNLDGAMLERLAERAKRLMYGMRKRFGRDPDVCDFLMAFRDELGLDEPRDPDDGTLISQP